MERLTSLQVRQLTRLRHTDPKARRKLRSLGDRATDCRKQWDVLEQEGIVRPVNPAHPVIRRDTRRAAVLRVELPLPPAELQMNRRLGRQYGGLLKHTEQAKGDAHKALYAVIGPDPPPWKRVRARATFTFRERRKRDDDNLTAWTKATRDQMAHDLGIDDHDWHWERPVVVVNKQSQPGMMIEIWEIVE